MPSQTVSSPQGVVTISYGSGSNSAQFSQFAGSVSQFVSQLPPSQVQFFSGSGFNNQPVTGTAAFIDPGSFVLSPQTQSVVVENNTANTITGGGDPALTILSGNGPLTYVAPSGNTTVVAGGGGNLIDFQSGLANAAYLNSGSNTVTSDSGNSTISAGTGNNTIVIGSGTANILSGGTDTVTAASGSETINVVGLNGGPAVSHDLVYGGSSRVQFVNGGATSTVYGGSGASDTLYGGAGGGVFAGGTGGNNALVGGSGAATLYGGGAGDTLYAGSGSNALVAGSGSETLVAGSGNASMFGGSGPDLFSFTNGQAGGQDVIGNFNTATDKVTLQGYGAGAASTALSTAAVSNGSETLTLSDGTKVTFSGVSNLSSSSFV